MAHIHTSCRHHPSKLTTQLTMGTAGLLGLLLSQGVFAVSCNFQNGDNFTDICGYLEAGTVQTGGQMKLHVSSTTPHFNVSIKRAGNDDENLLNTSFDGAGNHSANSHTQLNWGSAYAFVHAFAVVELAVWQHD